MESSCQFRDKYIFTRPATIFLHIISPFLLFLVMKRTNAGRIIGNKEIDMGKKFFLVLVVAAIACMACFADDAITTDDAVVLEATDAVSVEAVPADVVPTDAEALTVEENAEVVLPPVPVEGEASV